ncbi:MAG TPA: hypothetical protein ENI23_05735 [bacterium]|nr:hypothetical protein [bacterium]
MPDKNKETERLLRIAKSGALAVHDEVVELEEVVEKNHTEIREDIKETKGLIKEVVGIERLKGDTPTDKEIVALIEPLIPKPIKGEDGRNPIHIGRIEPTNPQKGDLWYQN